MKTIHRKIKITIMTITTICNNSLTFNKPTYSIPFVCMFELIVLCLYERMYVVYIC